MSKIFIILLFLCFFIVENIEAHEQEEECHLPLNVLKSPFSSDGEYTDLSPFHLEKENRKIHHHIKLKDNTTVKYEEGGCVDHAKTFLVELPYNLSNTVLNDENIKAIMSVMQTIPLNETARNGLFDNINYLISVKDKPDLRDNNIESNSQIAVYGEYGELTVITIETENSFSIHNVFYL